VPSLERSPDGDTATPTHAVASVRRQRAIDTSRDVGTFGRGSQRLRDVLPRHLGGGKLKSRMRSIRALRNS